MEQSYLFVNFQQINRCCGCPSPPPHLHKGLYCASRFVSKSMTKAQQPSTSGILRAAWTRVYCALRRICIRGVNWCMGMLTAWRVRPSLRREMRLRQSRGQCCDGAPVGRPEARGSARRPWRATRRCVGCNQQFRLMGQPTRNSGGGGKKRSEGRGAHVVCSRGRP
eukprot:2578267-Pleurochrysis_carterae.AAC.1